MRPGRHLLARGQAVRWRRAVGVAWGRRYSPRRAGIVNVNLEPTATWLVTQIRPAAMRLHEFPREGERQPRLRVERHDPSYRGGIPVDCHDTNSSPPGRFAQTTV